MATAEGSVAGRRGTFAWRFVAWLAGVAATTQLFEIFDWNRGYVRFALLAALAVQCFVLPPLLGPPGMTLRASRTLFGGLLLVVTVAALAHLVAGVRIATRVAGEGETQLHDMARANYRAIELLERGRDPWGRGEPVDFMSVGAVYDQARRDGCLRATEDETRDRMQQDWATFRRVDVETLTSGGGDATRCEAAADLLSYTGLKYGPGMVAAYYPFVVALRSLGMPASNFAFFVGMCVCVVWLARRLAPSTGLGVVSALALVVVPTPLMRCTLVDLDCDNAPVFFALLGVVLLERRRDALASLSLAVSVATKLLPGALFVPLLLRCTPRTWLWLLVGLAVLVVPLALWDPAGLAGNLVLLNLTRPADSTALAFFVPRWVHVGLLVAGAAGMLALVRWGHRRGWGRGTSVRYLVAAVLITLGGGKVLHTNYLVWLQPLLGLLACVVLHGPVSGKARSS